MTIMYVLDQNILNAIRFIRLHDDFTTDTKCGKIAVIYYDKNDAMHARFECLAPSTKV